MARIVSLVRYSRPRSRTFGIIDPVRSTATRENVAVRLASPPQHRTKLTIRAIFQPKSGFGALAVAANEDVTSPQGSWRHHWGARHLTKGDAMFCTTCGGPLADGDAFCSCCDVPHSNATPPASPLGQARMRPKGHKELPPRLPFLLAGFPSASPRRGLARASEWPSWASRSSPSSATPPDSLPKRHSPEPLGRAPTSPPPSSSKPIPGSTSQSPASESSSTSQPLPMSPAPPFLFLAQAALRGQPRYLVSQRVFGALAFTPLWST